MMTIVISLAISLAPIAGFHSVAQQESSANATPQTQRVQRTNDNASRPEGTPKPIRTIGVSPLALPPSDNAWAVQIVLSGGLTGADRKDLTLTSDGLLTWSGAAGSCSRKLTDEITQSLTKLVLAANAPATGSESSLSWMCFDCYVTTMLLQRRGTGGVLSAVLVSWDDVSQAQVTADMVSIYKAAIAHKGCNL
jgi:hypothetical protein